MDGGRGERPARLRTPTEMEIGQRTETEMMVMVARQRRGRKGWRKKRRWMGLGAVAR
uniref:Uncharacterized protein n=1 Tax=Cucumis melo TaxID=3656 RepID=A0A9I9CD53_CUCME